MFRKWVIEVSFLSLSVTHTISVLSEWGLEVRRSVRRASGFVQGIHIRSCSEAFTAGFPDQRQFIPTILIEHRAIFFWGIRIGRSQLL
jgi:hypothetical protein